MNSDAVAALIAARRPAAVVHLAAVSAVGRSVHSPRQTWDVNLGGTLNLVLALQAHAPDAHLLFVSSAEVYGETFAEGRPLREDEPLRPLNPYAASKAAAEVLVGQAARAGLFATIARPFNHTGPGQSADFVVPAFAAQIAAAEAGLAPPVVRVGDLEPTRDFLDVRDVADAYVRILERRRELPNGAVLNIASERSYRIGDVLQELLHLSKASIAVEVDQARLRPNAIMSVAGDASKARKLLGWEPALVLVETLRAVLDSARAQTAPRG
jgi:GDP-4-dehydro-6-deoxy-D-mannose reductase